MKVLLLVHQDLVPPEEKKSQKIIDLASWKTEYDVLRGLKNLGHDVFVLGIFSDLKPLRQAVETFKPHVVFNLLEEFAGEAMFDQNVVSYLEALGVKYTGCNPKGLILARDKALSKKILSYHGLLVPDFFVLEKGKPVTFPNHLDYPLFVKIINEEGSLGISQASVVTNEKQLRERVDFLFQKYQSSVIVEKYIEGREIYVGVLGNTERSLETLPPLELFFGNMTDTGFAIATNKAKWDLSYRKKQKIKTGKAKLDPFLEKRISQICKKAFSKLNLNGYVRMDLRLAQDKSVYLIEVNPNPDIGHKEEFSDSASFRGLEYEQLLAKVLSLALLWDPVRSA